MQKEKINHSNFEVKMYDFEPLQNSGFVKGKCRVAYAGENRNYTRIFKEAFEKAIPTVYNIPVVGNWIESKNNFGGHDVVLESEGNDIKFKSKTIPYGVIPESCNPRWEDVTDEYGNTKSYFTVDVILWKERYQKQIEKVENDGVNQSMEIMVTDGDWDKDYEYFDVNDFYFSALCLLGREINEHGEKGNDDVEPCFENAEVTTYSFDKDIFQKKFTFMLDEINKITKYSKEEFNNEGGEEDMTDDTKEIVENDNNDIQEEVTEVDNTETEVEIDKVETQNEEETNEVEETEDKSSNKDEEIVEDEQPKEDFKLKYEELSVQFSQLQIFKNDLEQKFNSLETEINELREYKQNIENEKLRVEKEQIFNDYSLILDEEEMKEIKDDIDDYSVEDIQKKLSVIYSIKSINNVKKEKQPKETTAVENLKIIEISNEETDKFAVR